MKKVINKKKYDTEMAMELAYNEFGNVAGQYNVGYASSLYRTHKSNYFRTRLSSLRNECDTLFPVSVEEALEFYEAALDQLEVFEVAFPNVVIEDA